MSQSKKEEFALIGGLGRRYFVSESGLVEVENKRGKRSKLTVKKGFAKLRDREGNSVMVDIVAWVDLFWNHKLDYEQVNSQGTKGEARKQTYAKRKDAEIAAVIAKVEPVQLQIEQVNQPIVIASLAPISEQLSEPRYTMTEILEALALLEAKSQVPLAA